MDLGVNFPTYSILLIQLFKIKKHHINDYCSERKVFSFLLTVLLNLVLIRLDIFIKMDKSLSKGVQTNEKDIYCFASNLFFNVCDSCSSKR